MISVQDLDYILRENPKAAWQHIMQLLWDGFSRPIDSEKVESEATNRDKATSSIELLLSGVAWELWDSYESSVCRTSQAIVDFWNNNDDGKAVFILDGLSLRETPYILEGLKARGYKIDKAIATGSELPAMTNTFAKSLGFSHRGVLENNGAGKTHKLYGAKTDCIDLPWKDCIELIGSEKDWVLWHQWPDSKMHEFDKPGYGLNRLSKEIYQSISSEDFWKLIERSSNGRTVIITGDHGYAASGLFLDVTDIPQKEYLKDTYKSMRYKSDEGSKINWLPPIERSIKSIHGIHSFVLGRRKWKSAGGYPTLTHGGISLLEIAVPYIQFRRGGI